MASGRRFGPGRGPLSVFLSTLALLLCLVPVVPAQHVESFTKDDCNEWSNPAGQYECDDVDPPRIPTSYYRQAGVGGIVRYNLRLVNDDVPIDNHALEDLLPPCAQIDCGRACMDTDCDTVPDSGPVWVTFSGTGFSSPPTCDEATNQLGIHGISLGPGEVMDIWFCANLVSLDLCCNQASLLDGPGGSLQYSTDFLLGDPEMCIEVGGSPPPCPPLTFGSILNAAPGGDCGMGLSWSPAEGGRGEVVYDLYRDTTSPVAIDPASLVASNLTGTSFLDTVAWGGIYTYRAVARDQCADPGPQEAINAGGDSPLASPVDETPPSFGGVTDTEDAGFCNVLVHWDDATALDDCSGIGLFNIYRDNGVGHAGDTWVGSDTDGSPYEDTTPGNGVWVYVVRAVNGAGLEEQNEIFVQESENSCTNDFPRDAGMKKGKNVDPPNADKQKDFRILGMGFEGEFLDIRINWEGSPDEGGLYPVTYSVLRGDLDDLGGGSLRFSMVDGAACGIAEDHYVMTGQVDGVSYYYIVAPVSGDNATFGYDSTGVERPEAAVCE